MACKLFNSKKCLNKSCNENIESFCASFKKDNTIKGAKVSLEDLIARKLAEIIHNKTCNWNHTDGCSWAYESWDNIGAARQEHLNIARKMLKQVKFEDAKYVMECLR